MSGLHRSVAELAALLPLPATAKWPGGVRDVTVLDRHDVELLFFAPEGIDHQTPHARDELYIVARGGARFTMTGDERAVVTGDMLFVSARTEHRFHAMTEGFAAWVIFFGPRSQEE